MELVIVLCVIGIVCLLSAFLPKIIKSIPAIIGLVVLFILIAGVVFIITL